jgi:DNA processing protein
VTVIVHNAAEGPQDRNDEAIAACALSSVPGMGAASLARVARAFGSFARAVEAGPFALASSAAARLTPRAREFLARAPDLRSLGAWAVDAAREAGARVVALGSDAYPELLARIADPPPVLYVRGELPGGAKRIALVGARAADEPALQLAREMGEDLAAAGIEVVSGGARGVDASAHAGALWGGGRTVAVLGTGIDVPYPPENAALFEQIAASGGALVSELPPGTPSSRPNFPRRNRIIAGLSHATIVVRAAAASGALITAKHARALGRPVFAVPAPPGDRLGAGPEALLRAGIATPITATADLLRALGWPVSGDLAMREADRRANEQASVPLAPLPPVEEALDGPARSVWDVLQPGRPLSADSIAARAGLRAGEVLRTLTELELKGCIQQEAGKYFVRRAGWS